MIRKSGGCVLDGFNWYHFIDKLKMCHFDWVVLFKLSHSIYQDHAEKLTPIVYFSDFVMNVSDCIYISIPTEHLEKNNALH